MIRLVGYGIDASNHWALADPEYVRATAFGTTSDNEFAAPQAGHIAQVPLAEAAASKELATAKYISDVRTPQRIRHHGHRATDPGGDPEATTLLTTPAARLHSVVSTIWTWPAAFVGSSTPDTSLRTTATVACMTLSVSTGQAVDLRVQLAGEVLDRVERSLQVRLLPDMVVRKRRSVGAGTDRDTWVRIERRLLDKIPDQGWNGTESAARLEGIAQPDWHGCVVWRDADGLAMWRADETELLPGTPIGSAVLSAFPALPDEWWDALNASLDALAAQRTRRVATPDTDTITQALVTESIRGAFSDSFDTAIERWVPAHADLNWANMTAPAFSLFDWEDWGNAPLGLDSASLWASSLAVPALADRVRHERRSDFESREGKLMTLFACSKILGPYAHPEDPRLEPARRMAEQVVKELQAG